MYENNLDENLKIALVHDYLHWYGGAERVLETLKEIFPKADIFTSVYTSSNMSKQINKMKVYPSFMQNLPFRKRLLKLYTPFYPLAFESFDLSKYDLVISDSSGVAKSVLTRPTTCHISYTHTTPRFLWGYPTSYLQTKGKFLRGFVAPFFNNYLRVWDRWSSDRVDYFIANSNEVKGRIRKYYLRDSKVIYPPVLVNKFIPDRKITGKYFLTVSRLESFKNIDLAVLACMELNLPLRVVGTGPLLNKLRKLANGNKNIHFVGRISDEDLVKYMQHATAIIFPGAEDFGIVPIEAMAAGKAVIALREGGVLETVIEGKTGEFFNNPTVASLKAVLTNFNESEYNYKDCVEQAKKFDKSVFKEQLLLYIKTCLRDYKKIY